MLIRMTKTATYALLVTLLCALLGACGGGDADEDEPRQDRPVANCSAKPEMCR